MSRRDDRDRDRYRGRDRDYDSRRHRSRFEREPSPKRSRRDGKPLTEREPSNSDLDGRGHLDKDRKYGRGLKDALPLEVQSAAPVPKGDSVDVSKEHDKKRESRSNGGVDESKHSSAPTEVPRSRSYSQHDERGSVGQVGRNFGRKASTDRSRSDSKDTRNERPFQKATDDTQPKEEKPKADEVLPPPPPLPPSLAAKRPAFREKKAPLEPESSEKTTMEPSKPRFPDHPAQEGERREQRGRDYRNFRRPEKPFSEDRRPYRGEARRDSFSSRERHGANGGGRDGFSSRERYGANGGGTNNVRDGLGRQGHHHQPSGSTVTEKWKHDLYDEANTSPPPKNEEDQIAKVEALLAL